nr:MAG TPA: hypothetical protein [Caudoviricetes sp.]
MLVQLAKCWFKSGSCWFNFLKIIYIKQRLLKIEPTELTEPT